MYGQYAHTSNLIIPDNHIAYVLKWVSTSVAGWPLEKIDSASLQQSPADGTYSVDF